MALSWEEKQPEFPDLSCTSSAVQQLVLPIILFPQEPYCFHQDMLNPSAGCHCLLSVLFGVCIGWGRGCMANFLCAHELLLHKPKAITKMERKWGKKADSLTGGNHCP